MNTRTETRDTWEGPTAEQTKQRTESAIQKTREQETPNRNETMSPKNKDSLRGLWDDIRPTNTRTAGAAEGEERQQGTENPFEEIMTENVPSLEREVDVQAQEAHRAPGRRPGGPHPDASQSKCRTSRTERELHEQRG